MSYNNYVDADAALRAAHDHGDQATVAVVKHANPCGIAVGTDIAEAHRKAHECDPVSAFGGIIAANRPVTVEMARAVVDIFTEVVVAPGFEPEALEVLREKKNVRLLECAAPRRAGVESRPVSGGLLIQQRDAVDAVVRDADGAVTGGDDAAHWRLVSGDPADQAIVADLQFAWRAMRAVKSNAVLLARDGASVGIGMGQVNRVDSCHLAVSRAGEERARGSVAASDAFFPFADGLQVLLDAGVRAVVAPGGSVRDARSSRQPGRPAPRCTSRARGTSPTDRSDEPVPALSPPGSGRVAPRAAASVEGGGRPTPGGRCPTGAPAPSTSPAPRPSSRTEAPTSRRRRRRGARRPGASTMMWVVYAVSASRPVATTGASRRPTPARRERWSRQERGHHDARCEERSTDHRSRTARGRYGALRGPTTQQRRPRRRPRRGRPPPRRPPAVRSPVAGRSRGPAPRGPSATAS